MMAVDIREALETTLRILRPVSRFTRNEIDDAFVELLYAIVESGPLLDWIDTKLAADIPAGALSSTDIPEPLREELGGRRIGDGTLLAKFFEALPTIIQIIKAFR